MTEKRIKFEDLTDEEFQNLTDEEMALVDYPADLFFDPDLAERAKKLDEDIASGKVKSIVLSKGDSKFEGFK